MEDAIVNVFLILPDYNLRPNYEFLFVIYRSGNGRISNTAAVIDSYSHTIRFIANKFLVLYTINDKLS